MDITDNNPKDPESGMGNEVSHSEGVRQSVGGGGSTGQFHRVLVESEYALPDCKEPIVTDDIHHQTTLKIRGVDSEAELKGEDDPEKQPKLNTSDDSDYSLIEECKALISEAADRAVQRTLSRTSKAEQVTDLDEVRVEEAVEEVQVIEQAKSVSVLQAEPVSSKPGPSGDSTYSSIDFDDDFKIGVNPSEIKSEKVESKIAESVKRSDSDACYALKCGILTSSTENIFDPNKKENKGKKRKSKSADNIFQREVIESVKEHFENEDNSDTENQTPETKRSKGSFIAKMFKFSKRKHRTDADVSVDIKSPVKNEIVEENENVQENNVQIAKSVDSEVSNSEQHNKRNREVRRLNSLDSGIVVDKISELANNSAVEYAVVQKTKTKIKDLIKTNNDESLQTGTDDITKTVSQRHDTENVTSVKADNKSEHTETVYLNGDKTDEDFVYINERAVDVDGLVEPVKTTMSETLPSLVSGEPVSKPEEKQLMEDENQSTVSNDSGTSSGSVIRRSDIKTPEKGKVKKKSWSFQLGGKKKPSDEMESASVVSMDPNACQTVETKKSKWKFGKFSFRKGSDDVSTSTPNLHNAGIPEGGEVVTMRKQPEDKKKMKLKKIKAKKEKKRSSKNGSSLDQRSTSMIDIGRGESLAPRSRRSIVEEDLDFTQTDVFEGVSLSDLSQDEETEVSTNPAGGQVGTKKGSSKKLIDKSIDIVKSIVETKTVKDTKQASSDTAADTDLTQKGDETKLTKSESFEDKTVKSAETSGDTVAELHASLNPEHIEDEYVNIVNRNAQTLNSAAPQIAEIITEDAPEDVEYAQVIKTKVKVVEEDADKTKEIVQSSVPEQVLKLDAAKVLNTETNENKAIETTNATEMVKNENTNEDESKAEEFEQKSGETAFSNMIYSDEEFRATLASMVTTKGDHDQEDESDAYVELQQIVEDFSQEKEISQNKGTDKDEIKTKSNDSEETAKAHTEKTVNDSGVATEVATRNITVQDNTDDISGIDDEKHTGKTDTTVQDKDKINGIVEEKLIERTESAQQETEVVKPVVNEVTEKSVAAPVESLITTPAISEVHENTETDTVESVTKVNREGGLIVLKDVGVQVPDIYMPLDKDKDFGFTANNVPCVSIGIQVTDKDLDIEHVVVTMNTEDGSEKVSPAYF